MYSGRVKKEDFLSIDAHVNVKQKSHNHHSYNIDPECDDPWYKEDHEGGHGSCDDKPIKLNENKKCQDEVFWHFWDLFSLSLL